MRDWLIGFFKRLALLPIFTFEILALWTVYVLEMLFQGDGIYERLTQHEPEKPTRPRY